MKPYLNILLTLFVATSLNAVASNPISYRIDASVADKVIHRGHLNLGGESASNQKMSFNSYYMDIDGVPYIPIMGEVHFSRIPNSTWEEQILKMKSGGINVIATYVFWSIHEEYEGTFDWSGDKNLRVFLELCRKHNMNTIVRIGPFCHGEIRNGGIPDWLYGRPFQIRTNDPLYLKYVDRLYENIATELSGLYYKDGGTIIGIQLENELQHSAAPWSFNYPGQPREFTVADYDIDNTKIGVSVQQNQINSAQAGEQHMRTLKDIAIAKGMIVPLYTATGWGNAAILTNEVIPVTSAYPYPFWEDKVKASPFYLFKDIQKHPDYEPVRYETDKYPSFCAEMGAGIQMIYARRPQVPADAAEGLMLRSLGSGANGIGYYMYHGGTTPQGRFGFFSDEPMGVPKMSYDFQAPIGEFGHTRDSYNALRLLHLFTEDFGDRLAPMGVVLPTGYDTIRPKNIETLRYAVRKRGNSGFVFITNFQDHVENKNIEDINITVTLQDENIRIPFASGMTISKNVSAILPFNLSLDGVMLKSATVQPLAKLVNEKHTHYFFYAHPKMNTEYVFESSTLKSGSTPTYKDKNVAVFNPKPGLTSTLEFTSQDGRRVLVTTLTREQALNANRLNSGGKQLLVITEANVMQHTAKLRFQQTNNELDVVFFPAIDIKRSFSEYNPKHINNKFFSRAMITLPKVEIEPQLEMATNRRFKVNLPTSAFDGLSDLILSIDYIGDTGAAFIDGKMVTDHFFSGAKWNIGLKRFIADIEHKGLYFYLRPIYQGASYMIDLPKDLNIDFSKGDVCIVNSIKVIPEYYIECKI